MNWISEFENSKVKPNKIRVILKIIDSKERKIKQIHPFYFYLLQNIEHKCVNVYYLMRLSLKWCYVYIDIGR